MIPATIALLSGCASLPENVNRIESRALDDTRDTALGIILAAVLDVILTAAIHRQ